MGGEEPADSQQRKRHVNRGGRPSRKTARVIRRLLQGYRLVGMHTPAAGYVPIDPATVRRWREQDRRLCRLIEQAQAECAAAHAIALAKVDTPEEHEKALRRLAGAEYNLATKQEFSGPGGAPLPPFQLIIPPAEPAPPPSTSEGGTPA